MTPACMGGWCSHRDRCERHTTDQRAEVAERLCAKGEELVQFKRPADQSRAPARLEPEVTYRQAMTEALTKQPGLTANQVAELIDRDVETTSRELCYLCSRGSLFQMNARPRMRYFASEEQREAMRAQVQAETAAYVADRDANKAARNRAREQARYYALKAERDLLPKPARKKRVDKPKDSMTPARAKFNARPRQVVMVDKREPVIPAHVKVQRLPGIERIYDKPPQRVVGGFSDLGPGKYL